MRTLIMVLESFLVAVLLLAGLVLGFCGILTSQILLSVLGAIVFYLGFRCMIYVWIKYPESRNDTYDNSPWNNRERMARAFYNWESLSPR